MGRSKRFEYTAAAAKIAKRAHTEFAIRWISDNQQKKRCIYSIFGFTCTVRCGDGAGTAAHALDGQCSETCVSIWKRGTWIFQFRPAILKANILRSIALHTILWNDYYFTGDGAPISILNMSFVWAAADCVFGDIRYMKRRQRILGDFWALMAECRIFSIFFFLLILLCTTCTWLRETKVTRCGPIYWKDSTITAEFNWNFCLYRVDTAFYDRNKNKYDDNGRCVLRPMLMNVDLLFLSFTVWTVTNHSPSKSAAVRWSRAGTKDSSRCASVSNTINICITNSAD